MRWGVAGNAWPEGEDASAQWMEAQKGHQSNEAQHVVSSRSGNWIHKRCAGAVKWLQEMHKKKRTQVQAQNGLAPQLRAREACPELHASRKCIQSRSRN